MVTKIMFVLMLYLNGSVIEFMGHWEDPSTGEWTTLEVSGCLTLRRTLERNGWSDNEDTDTRYACERHTVLVEDNWEGREVVRKILD